MATKELLTESIYNRCRNMLFRLLKDSPYLGGGYTIQLVYELLVVVSSYKKGSTKAVDTYMREVSSQDVNKLIRLRNICNHNSYDSKALESYLVSVLDSKIIERLYIMFLGEAPGYSIFETECYVYLEHMKRLWGDK